MAKIGVIGAGSWGTALAWLLTNNGHEVTLWSHREEDARLLQKERENKSKLPGVIFQENLQVTGDLQSTVEDKNVLVLAVPSPAVRSTSQKLTS